MPPIRHLNCPQCGGTLGAHGLERIVRCRYCQIWALVESDDLIPEYWVRPKLDQNAARRAVQKLLTDRAMPQGLLQLSKFHSARLSFVPFHEVSARRTGTMILTIRQEVRRSPIEREDQVLSPMGFIRQQEEDRMRERQPNPTKDTRVVMSDVARLEPAIDLPGWCLPEAELGALRTSTDAALQPINRREMEKLGSVHHPTLTPQNIVAQLELRAETAGLEDHTEFTEVRAKRIYYPVWRVRYLYQSRLYGATLDGVTGKVMTARAPQDDRSRVLWLLGMSAAACLLPGRILGATVSQIFSHRGSPLELIAIAVQLPELVIPAFIIGLVGLVIFLGIGWEEFRYPGEIVICGDRRDVEKINKPENTVFDKIRDGLMKVLDQGLKIAARRSGQ